MTWLERPDIEIENVKGKELANEIRELAKRLGIDLFKANEEETKKILKNLNTSLSDEIVKMRENSE
jgi:hypothetical protein